MRVGVGRPLGEAAAVSDGQQLRAAADRERRQPRRAGGAQQPQLERIGLRVLVGHVLSGVAP